RLSIAWATTEPLKIVFESVGSRPLFDVRSDITVAAGQTVNKKIHVYGGTAPYTFALDGELPDGLSLQSDGTIVGLAANPPASSTFDVIVEDAEGNTRQKTYQIPFSASSDLGAAVADADIEPG